MLSQFDPTRALELLEKQHFQDPGLDASLRYRIAAELLATDPVEAESIVAAIASPRGRALGYVWLAEAMPATERDRRRGLLERATVQVQAPSGDGRGSDPHRRLFELARVAGGWLDLGEVEKARQLIHEGLEQVAALPPLQRYVPNFLPTAARMETDRVLSLISDLGNARRRSCYVAIVEALAIDHPAEAERVFQLIDDSSDVPCGESKNRNRPSALPAHGEDRSRTGTTADRRAENAPTASLRLGPRWRSAWPTGTGRPRARPWPSRSGCSMV